MSKYILVFVVGILLIDMFGFMFWVVSGQMPVDNFYAGVITKTIISLIF